MSREDDGNVRGPDINHRHGFAPTNTLHDLECCEVLICVTVDSVRYVSRINRKKGSNVCVRQGVPIIIHSNDNQAAAGIRHGDYVLYQLTPVLFRMRIN